MCGGERGLSCERSGILVISLRDVNRGFWSDEDPVFRTKCHIFSRIGMRLKMAFPLSFFIYNYVCIFVEKMIKVK